MNSTKASILILLLLTASVLATLVLFPGVAAQVVPPAKDRTPPGIYKPPKGYEMFKALTSKDEDVAEYATGQFNYRKRGAGSKGGGYGDMRGAKPLTER